MALSRQPEHCQATGLFAPPHGAFGWHRTFYHSDIDAAAEQMAKDGNWAAHLAADDLLQAVSSDAGDTTQTCYVRGIDTNDKVRIEAFTLNGTTAVDSAAKFRFVETAWVNAETAGNITVRRKTGPANICVITAGQLKAYIMHRFNGECATYLHGLWVGLGDNVTDSVLFELRWYPDDADSRDLGDGYEVLASPVGLVATVAQSAVVPMNPPPLVFPQPLRLPPGGYLTLYATAAAANQQGWGVLQGYDVLET